MNCPYRDLGADKSNKSGYDGCLLKWIRDYYIIIKGKTMDDDSTKIVYCVFAHTIILRGF